MSSIKVLVSGANGFIGQEIIRFLHSQGIETLGIRRKHNVNSQSETIIGELGSDLPSNIFQKYNIVSFIHCANAMGDNSFELNVHGTQQWAKQASNEGVQHQVFLSSVSAMSGNSSDYGRSKKILQDWFCEQGLISLCLGLVIGRGGVFKRMVDLISKYPLMPLLDNGNHSTYFTGINSLNTAIFLLLKDKTSHGGRILNLQQQDSILMKSLLKTIRKNLKTRCLFIPVPSLLIYWLVFAIENIPFLSMGMSSTNIKGLRENSNIDLKSDLLELNIKEFSMDEQIKINYLNSRF